MNETEQVLTVRNEVGEGPIWNPEEHALYWVDIQNHCVYRFYPTSAWLTLSEEDKKNQPLAGDLFRVIAEVKGLEERKFGVMTLQT